MRLPESLHERWAGHEGIRVLSDRPGGSAGLRRLMRSYGRRRRRPADEYGGAGAGDPDSLSEARRRRWEKDREVKVVFGFLVRGEASGAGDGFRHGFAAPGQAR